jgi:thioester reductase-like protein
MSTIFFTGFPGFLGRELLPRLLARHSADRALCLVQDKFLPLAHAAIAAIETSHPAARGRIEIARGDITLADLGLGAARELVRDVREIHHLAAIYDLSVPRARGREVNVTGTRNVIDFAARCPALERLHYVSTCYVSGRHAGIFAEDDLDVGQVFNNFYEETKFEAEVLVREAMRGGLGATIYRPSVVVGDSRTGATQKLDGPYYLIRWILRQRSLAFVPVIGDPSRFRFNAVPRDFVVDAIDYLSAEADGLGKTYQLCDHAPPTWDEVLTLLGRASGRTAVRVPLPLSLTKLAIDRAPGVQRLTQIPSSLVDYMQHPTHYLNRATLAALAPAGLAAPPFASYAPHMTEFVRRNLHMSSAALA